MLLMIPLLLGIINKEYCLAITCKDQIEFWQRQKFELKNQASYNNRHS